MELSSKTELESGKEEGEGFSPLQVSKKTDTFKEQQKKKRALLVDAQSVRKNVNSLLHLMRKVEKRQERQRMSKEQVWCHARCCQLTKEQSVFVSLVAGLTISKV